MKKSFLCCTTLLLIFLSCACTRPSPLYGSWFSIDGDELILNVDGTFSSSITIEEITTELKGSWKHTGNVIEFQANSTGFNSIWNIDGTLLQLTWPSDTNGNTINLEMFRKEAQ